MTTHHQEIPNSVQVDVVVSTPPTAASGGATQLHDGSEDDRHRCYCTCRIIFAIISICVLLVFTILDILNYHHPSFKVESMSVALDKFDISNNQSEAIKAAWDVGFSIKHPGREFGVSVRCMSSNWSASVIEGVRNTNSVDAVVITQLPREFVLPELVVRGLTLQYDVLFWTNRKYSVWEGVCKNMSVAISPNATRGVMVGGRRSCRVHHRY